MRHTCKVKKPKVKKFGCAVLAVGCPRRAMAVAEGWEAGSSGQGEQVRFDGAGAEEVAQLEAWLAAGAPAPGILVRRLGDRELGRFVALRRCIDL